MTTGKRETAGRGRVWPGIIAPGGLTLLLAIAAWLFVARVDGDQERAEAAALRLEGYARLEAREISGLAADHARRFLAQRLAARESQINNLRLEVRAIMDAVHRQITSGLEKSRQNAVARRDVGRFPPGFEGVRSYLEIAPVGQPADAAVETLRSFSTELAALLPAGCSLAVIEDSSRELLSLGGGLPPEGAVAEAAIREYIFDDGGRSRHWTIRVGLQAPDAHPVPDAREIAAAISDKVAYIRLDNVAWRGWLVGPGGEVKAAFPEAAARGQASGPDEPPPYLNQPGQWKEIEGGRMVWLELARNADPSLAALIPAVTVAIPRPAPPLELVDEFGKDWRWSLTLTALALLALGGWGWFAHRLSSTRRDTAGAAEQAEASGEAAAARARRRLVRDDGAVRAIPEVQGVIVADIGSDGSVNLATAPDGARAETVPAKPRTMPSGSLFRLQGIHRGREGMQGSRILDFARSQVLRELASRVRPAAGLGTPAEPRGQTRAVPKGQEKIPAMKSPTGWKKVEE